MVALSSRCHALLAAMAIAILAALLIGCSANVTPLPLTPTARQITSSPPDQSTPTSASASVAQRPTTTAQPSPTPFVEPSSTPVLPTGTLSVTGPDGCTLQAQFIADVTIPDNRVMAAGAAFIKTWRVKNTGTCTWSGDYQVVFDSGQAMNGFAPVSLSPTSPGNMVDISINLVAPTEPGNYTGRWRLVSSNAVPFSGLTVMIIVAASTPTVTLTPTPTLTPTLMPPGLSSELFYGVVGVGPPCYDVPQPGSLPAVQFVSRSGDMTSLCLWGFAADQPITLTLTAPDNTRYTGIPAWLGKLPNFIWARLWLPAGLRHRGWHVTAEAGQIVAISEFDLPQLGGGKLSAYPPDALDPFQSVDEQVRDDLVCPHYSLGQAVRIAGEGFQPNQLMAMGVYYVVGPNHAHLFRGMNVQADNTGHVLTTLPTANSDAAGYYLVHSNVSASSSGIPGEAACYHIQ